MLARFSGVLWRGERERLDVLGLALRMRPGSGASIDHRAADGDTDLLTATIRSPFTMLGSPLFTDAGDSSVLNPVGLVHAIRRATYAANQHARA